MRKAIAWRAIREMDNIWKSSLNKTQKTRIFKASVESILLYGAETWTLTENEKRRLGGSYTRMLRVVLNRSWKDKVKSVDLYGGLPRLSDVIKKRRLRLAGHAYRRSEEIVSKLVLWKPTHGYTCRGRPKLSFHQMLKKDAGVENIEELGTLMKDRDVWRKVVEGVASVSSSVSYTVTT